MFPLNLPWISMHERKQPFGLIALLVIVAVWGFGAVFFFRYPFISAFDSVLGDRGDGRVIVFIHEHLYRVLQGRADWTSPPFFYPQRGALGFVTAYILNLPLYAFFRWLGLNPFSAFQLLLVILSLASFLSSWIICRRYLNIRNSIALCAALIVTFPNNLYFKAGVGHTQFLMTYYIPCLVALTLRGLENFPRVTPGSAWPVIAAAAAFGLLFATEGYVAWMFALTLVIAVGALCICHGESIFPLVRSYRQQVMALLGVAFIALLIGLIPFLLIYVPVRPIAPPRTYYEYLWFAPTPVDLLNVSRWNLVWGWLVERALGERGAERALSVSPGMTVLFLLLACAWRKSKRGSVSWISPFLAACIAVWLMSWLFTFKIGTVSGFWIVQHLIPGAGGIRAGMRIQLLVSFWLVAGLAVLLDQWIRFAPVARLRQRKLLVAAALSFCLIEQVNLMNNASLPASQELKWLCEVPPPPAQCQAFLEDVPNPPAHYLDQVDAMWISLQTGLPTLNGQASWAPPRWRLDGRSKDYREAAREWISATQLKDRVCLYDREAKRWSIFE